MIAGKCHRQAPKPAGGHPRTPSGCVRDRRCCRTQGDGIRASQTAAAIVEHQLRTLPGDQACDNGLCCIWQPNPDVSLRVHGVGIRSRLLLLFCERGRPWATGPFFLVATPDGWSTVAAPGRTEVRHRWWPLRTRPRWSNRGLPAQSVEATHAKCPRVQPGPWWSTPLPKRASRTSCPNSSSVLKRYWEQGREMGLTIVLTH